MSSENQGCLSGSETCAVHLTGGGCCVCWDDGIWKGCCVCRTSQFSKYHGLSPCLHQVFTFFKNHVVAPPGEGPRALLGLGRGGTCIAADLNPPNHAHRRRRGVLVGKVHWFPVALYEGDPVDGVDAITRRSLSLSFVRTPMVFPASLRAVKQFGHFTRHGAERPRKRL